MGGVRSGCREKKNRPSYWQPGDVTSRPPPFITDYMNSITKALFGKIKRQSPVNMPMVRCCLEKGMLWTVPGLTAGHNCGRTSGLYRDLVLR